jgi:plasmid maintenance system killer protein
MGGSWCQRIFNPRGKKVLRSGRYPDNEYYPQRPMLIHFRTTKLEKEFSSAKELTRAYGAEQGRVLMRRVSELRAARRLADLRLLPQLRAHELAGDRKGQISITVRHPHRLILLVAHQPVPRREDGGLDWDAVTEVTIFEVVDYH